MESLDYKYIANLVVRAQGEIVMLLQSYMRLRTNESICSPIAI